MKAPSISPRFFTKWLAGLAVVFVGLWLLALSLYVPKCSATRATCLAHRQAGCSFDGDYSIQVAGRTMQATCDMRTDGGGWTLVGNYLHRMVPKTQERAHPTALIDHLPIPNGKQLGDDEFGMASWGHASTALLSLLPVGEMRFYCRSSGHDRVVDVVLSGKSCLDYFRTGKGACLAKPGLQREFQLSIRALPDNTGHLEQSDFGYQNAGENAVTLFPFYQNYKYAWVIGGEERWECDDFWGSKPAHTYHQIWIR